MKKLLLTILLILYCAPSALAQLTIDATSFPPGQELKPGVAVLLTVKGLEDGQKVLWHTNNIEGDVVLDMGSAKHRLFAGTVPGSRTFVLQVPSDGADPFTVCQFDYGNKTDPDPIPTPGPKWILIIEETDQGERTVELGNLLSKLRKEADSGWLKEQKHQLLILDKDLKLSNNQPHPLLVKEHKPEDVLPVIVIRDLSTGELVKRVALPPTYEEVRKIIELSSGS